MRITLNMGAKNEVWLAGKECWAGQDGCGAGRRGQEQRRMAGKMMGTQGKGIAGRAQGWQVGKARGASAVCNLRRTWLRCCGGARSARNSVKRIAAPPCRQEFAFGAPVGGEQYAAVDGQSLLFAKFFERADADGVLGAALPPVFGKGFVTYPAAVQKHVEAVTPVPIIDEADRKVAAHAQRFVDYFLRIIQFLKGARADYPVKKVVLILGEHFKDVALIGVDSAPHTVADFLRTGVDAHAVGFAGVLEVFEKYAAAAAQIQHIAPLVDPFTEDLQIGLAFAAVSGAWIHGKARSIRDIRLIATPQSALCACP